MSKTTMENAMRITAFLLLAATSLSACTTPGPSALARANADGARTAAVADGFISNVMSISGCPPGYHSVNERVRTSAEGVMTNNNGQVYYYIEATGNRSQPCVR